MTSSKIAVAVSFIGIAVAIIPVLLYIQSEIGGPLQRQFDTMIPMIPLHLLTAIIGSAITVSGLILFRQAIRSQPISPEVAQPPVMPARHEVRQPEKAPVRREAGGMLLRGRREDVTLIEKQLEEMLSSEETPDQISASLQAPTIHAGEKRAKPRQSTLTATKQTGNIVVVVEGTDMVCRNCGSINPLGARICSECGSNLFTPPKEGEPICPVCNAPLSQAQRIGDNYVCQVCFSELKIESL